MDGRIGEYQLVDGRILPNMLALVLQTQGHNDWIQWTWIKRKTPLSASETKIEASWWRWMRREAKKMPAMKPKRANTESVLLT